MSASKPTPARNRSRYTLGLLLTAGAIGCRDGAVTRPPLTTIESSAVPTPPAAGNTESPMPSPIVVSETATAGAPVGLSIELPGRSLSPGEEFAVLVRLDIAGTYEIAGMNALPPAVPTRLELELPDGWEQVGSWQVPPPSPSLRPGGYAGYSGRVDATCRVRVSSEAADGGHRLEVRLSYQACDDRRCLSPVDRRLATAVQVAR